MVQKLEDVKNVGESIKIGATGKISALMSRELQSGSPKSRKLAILKPKDDSELEEKAQTDEASTSNNKNIDGNLPKTKHNHARKDRKNPIFSSNSNKKRSYIVEVVDVKCGIPDKIYWANPIKDRLKNKKLAFSKKSETNGVN